MPYSNLQPCEIPSLHQVFVLTVCSQIHFISSHSVKIMPFQNVNPSVLTWLYNRRYIEENRLRSCICALPEPHELTHCGLVISFGNIRFTHEAKTNGHHFADDSFKCISLNENVWIPIKISVKFVPKGPINNIPALDGTKPLSEPVMVSLPQAFIPRWYLFEYQIDQSLKCIWSLPFGNHSHISLHTLS